MFYYFTYESRDVVYGTLEALDQTNILTYDTLFETVISSLILIIPPFSIVATPLTTPSAVRFEKQDWCLKAGTVRETMVGVVHELDI